MSRGFYYFLEKSGFYTQLRDILQTNLGVILVSCSRCEHISPTATNFHVTYSAKNIIETFVVDLGVGTALESSASFYLIFVIML